MYAILCAARSEACASHAAIFAIVAHRLRSHIERTSLARNLLACNSFGLRRPSCRQLYRSPWHCLQATVPLRMYRCHLRTPQPPQTMRFRLPPRWFGRVASSIGTSAPPSTEISSLKNSTRAATVVTFLAPSWHRQRVITPGTSPRLRADGMDVETGDTVDGLKHSEIYSGPVPPGKPRRPPAILNSTSAQERTSNLARGPKAPSSVPRTSGTLTGSAMQKRGSCPRPMG